MKLTTDIIDALDRLNSYARSKGDTRPGGTLTRAIYHYKGEALRIASDNGKVQASRIMASVKCRDCGGSGRYTDSWGYTHDHCRACGNTGKASLSFVVSTLWTGHAWHTPLMRWPSCKINTQSLVPIVDSYQPNQPGRDMTPQEVALDLYTVERWFWGSGECRRPMGGMSWQPWGTVREPSWLWYKLPLGEVEDKRCHWCHGEPSQGRYCASSRAYEWHDFACEKCFRVHGWTFEVPYKLAIVQPVWRWYEQHTAIVDRFEEEERERQEKARVYW